MAMPSIPTIAEIKARRIADIETALNQTTPLLPKAFTRVISGACAGIDILLYRSILWVYAQIFPDKADYASLVLLGRLVGIDPLPAVKAVIVASVPGVSGESVLVGTNFRATTGTVYQVTTGATIVLGVASCTLTALIAGDAGNIANGEVLTILAPDVNLTGTATVTSTTTDGDDAETEESLRVRVSNRYKKRYTGGSPADYEGWGLEAPHFIWVSPYAGDAPNEVVVYGEVDNETDGIPTSGQLATLLSYLSVDPVTGLANRRPVGDEVQCLPITRKIFDFHISIKGANATTKTNIETALAEYMAELEPYNEGVTIERNDAITESGASEAATAIAREAVATILALSLYEHSTSGVVQSYTFYGGDKPKMGTVTWTDVL